MKYQKHQLFQSWIMKHATHILDLRFLISSIKITHCKVPVKTVSEISHNEKKSKYKRNQAEKHYLNNNRYVNRTAVSVN